ncbi:potassium channel family protein [Motiliproteus sediminis]|uniref:potassium channel family protein n=1 Tax=Motiliproteus sediminis TaxID=1468178 RepID=UPI001AEF429F|nr:potassium channel family protein [Motiliproteus sediminis]
MLKFDPRTLLNAAGLGGVAADENAEAQRWGHLLEIPMLFVAIWILISWYLEHKGMITPEMGLMTDVVIWLMFVVETIVLARLVDNPTRYLKHNWLNLFIIAAGVPILWGHSNMAPMLRTLRMLILLRLLLRISGDARALLARHNLGTTLMVSFVVLLMSGFIIAGIDPAIKTPWQGIWWAWVTVTTVGYGDVVPSSWTGKAFAALLILMGIGLFSMLTASFSAFFIAQDEKEVLDAEHENIERLRQLEERLERIEGQLEHAVELLEVHSKHPPPTRAPDDSREQN